MPDLTAYLADFLHAGAAAWVRELGFRIVAATPGDVTFELPVTPDQIHMGGVYCGQAIMAAMDTGMVLVMASLARGTEREGLGFTTVSLNTVFERGVPGATEAITCRAWATRPGRTLVYGQIDCHLPTGRRAATATTTYMWR